jgi:adducin
LGSFFKGNVLDQGSTTYTANKTAFLLHETIYNGRKDVNCIIHIHTGVASSISSMKCGLLPISQEASLCGHLVYHDFSGNLNDQQSKDKLISDFADTDSRVLILRSFGVVFCGSTIEEAVFYLINFINATEIQLKAMAASGGVDNLLIPDKMPNDRAKLIEQLKEANESSTDGTSWHIGDIEFEAEMRKLDRLVIFLYFFFVVVNFFNF